MFTTSRPPGRVTRASSATKARSSATCSSMSTTATRSNSRVRERQAVAVHAGARRRHQLADGGHRLRGQVGRRPAAAAAAQQQAHHAVVGAEVQAAQPFGGAEQGRDLGQLALLEHRAAEERQRPGLAVSHGAPPARSPASPKPRVRPSARAPRLQPARERRRRRSARCRAMGRKNCGRRAVDAEALAGRRRPRPPRRAKTVNGRVSPSTLFFSPNSGAASGVHAAPRWVVDDHRAGGQPAQLAPPARASRATWGSSRKAERDVEGAVREGQRAAGRRPRKRAPAGVDQGWTRVAAGRGCRARSPSWPAAASGPASWPWPPPTSSTRAAGQGAQQVEGGARLHVQEPGAHRAGEAPGVGLGRGLDVRARADGAVSRPVRAASTRQRDEVDVGEDARPARRRAPRAARRTSWCAGSGPPPAAASPPSTVTGSGS